MDKYIKFLLAVLITILVISALMPFIGFFLWLSLL